MSEVATEPYAGLRERLLREADGSSIDGVSDQTALEAAEAISTLLDRCIALEGALARAAERFGAIKDFGNPDEIADEPEDFGGTDNGLESVCMAYENMQFIAERGELDARATLQGKGE